MNERTAVSTIRKSLYFQLVVSQSERFDFSGYIPAVDVALRLINSNASILPDYELKYTDIIDAKVSYWKWLFESEGCPWTDVGMTVTCWLNFGIIGVAN